MNLSHIINDRILHRIGLRLTRAPDLEKSDGERRRRELLATSSLAQKRLLKLADLLVPHRALDHSKIRLGGTNDGGYVCLNDFDKIDVAFSFGIGNDISWDVEIANKDIFVRQFDHTIEPPP